VRLYRRADYLYGKFRTGIYNINSGEQKTGEFECIRKANEKLKKADGIGKSLLRLYKLNKNMLKSKYKTYITNYFPMFAALVIFALLAEERNEEAVCAYAILLCDNYEYMNILYADLQKEKLLYQRNFKDIYDAVIRSCEFIEEVYLKINKPLKNDCFDYLRSFVKETVFENMIQDVRNIKNHYAQSQDKVKADMFRRLYNVMRALSEPKKLYG